MHANIAGEITQRAENRNKNHNNSNIAKKDNFGGKVKKGRTKQKTSRVENPRGIEQRQFENRNTHISRRQERRKGTGDQAKN